MGVDGSLAGIQVGSPAAGHVYAKTGTGISRSAPNAPTAVDLALAGFIQLPDLRWVVFAQFLHQATDSPFTVADAGLDAMGQITTIAYQTLCATTGAHDR